MKTLSLVFFIPDSESLGLLNIQELCSRTRGSPEFKITGRELSEDTVNFSSKFNTFLSVVPGLYGECSIVRLRVFSFAVITTIIWPLEKA